MDTKVIVFDFDGTLSKVEKGFNCWKAIWEDLNALEIDYKYYKMYANREITYYEWCDIIAEEYKKRNVTESMITRIGKKIKLHKNAEILLKTLKDNNMKIYILSGGIKNMIQASLGSLVKYIDDIQADYFTFNEKGEMLSLNTCEGHSVEYKDEFVNMLIKKHNILPQELLFVGNGENDETVYKTNARTLCLNPDDANYENKEVWHNVLWTDDLLDLIPYIKNKTAENEIKTT